MGPLLHILFSGNIILFNLMCLNVAINTILGFSIPNVSCIGGASAKSETKRECVA